MPNGLQQILQDRRAILFDGGMGTLLISAGLEHGQAPEWWNLENRSQVAAAHRSYVDAGADVITTNTFGANPKKLATVGLEGKCQQVNQAAVELAREVCDENTLLAGDLGPTGLLFPPMGDATFEGLTATFSEQASSLASAGVDLLIVETMYDQREAKAAVLAAKDTGLPVLATMTFEAKKRGFFTIVGDRIIPTFQSLIEAGADAVGFNCSVESDTMLEMIREAAQGVDVPLIGQPNAGQPLATPDGVVYNSDPRQFCADIVQMIEAGARIVGGCCGTTPEFIGMIRQRLDSLQTS